MNDWFRKIVIKYDIDPATVYLVEMVIALIPMIAFVIIVG